MVMVDPAALMSRRGEGECSSNGLEGGGGYCKGDNFPHRKMDPRENDAVC